MIYHMDFGLASTQIRTRHAVPVLITQSVSSACCKTIQDSSHKDKHQLQCV